MRRLTAACFSLVLAWVGGAGIATTALASEAPSPAEAPAIAPPAPEPSPRETDDAASPARAAELTPIVPSPLNPRHPAFQLYTEVDLPVMGIGLVFAGARLFRSQKAFCAPLCDRGDLNVLDRRTAGYWSPGWQDASNYGLAAIGVGAATFLFVDEGFWPGLNDGIVVAESALAGIAIASTMTLATGRPRPFVYGEKAPLSSRNSADAGLSFLSSHAVAGFAIATSVFVTTRRLHPGSKVTWIVLGVGGAVATFVATARVLGGLHFITDSLGGAVVGTSVGLLVPSLHGSPVAIAPVGGEGRRGLALTVRF